MVSCNFSPKPIHWSSLFPKFLVSNLLKPNQRWRIPCGLLPSTVKQQLLSASPRIVALDHRNECCCWKWKWHIISYNIYISLSTHIIPYNFGLRMFSFFWGGLDPELFLEILVFSFSNFPEWLQLDTESFSGYSPNSMNRQKKVDTALIDRRRRISKHTSSCTDKFPVPTSTQDSPFQSL